LSPCGSTAAILFLPALPEGAIDAPREPDGGWSQSKRESPSQNHESPGPPPAGAFVSSAQRAAKVLSRAAVAIGKQLSLTPERLHMVRRAALLHDLGKLRVPNTV
jgi:hypothetical protein